MVPLEARGLVKALYRDDVDGSGGRAVDHPIAVADALDEWLVRRPQWIPWGGYAIKSAVMGGAGDGHYVAVGSRFWSEHRIATVQSLVVEDLSPSVGLSHPEPEPLDISPLLTPQAH